MAHEITDRDGLFTVREPAWHGLGTVLPDYPTREQAQTLAHPWEPVTEPIFRRIPVIEPLTGGLSYEYEEISSHKAVVRSDSLDGDTLGVVGEGYEPVTNTEMWDIAEALQGEGTEVRYETGGSLKGGRKVWALLRLDEPVVVPGDPNGAVIPYYALQNAHDGSGSFRGQATMTRIVCDNTAQMADLDAKVRGTEFTFRHTVNVRDRIEEAKLALAGWRESVTEWNRIAEHLVGVQLTGTMLDEFLYAFVPEPAANLVSDRVRDNITRTRDDIVEILRSETCAGIDHTAYGLLSATLEYQQHVRRTKGKTDGDRSENRFKRAYLDRSALTRDAVSLIREVCHA